MRKRLSHWILAITLLVSACLPVFAAEHPFSDVPDGMWYSEAENYVYTRGLMSGVSGDCFSPQGTMTRGMAVTVLYRLCGSPEPEEACPFGDVSPSVYYYNAVCWAYGQNITSGTSAITFSPSDFVTREQLVAFLYRCAGAMGASTSYKLSVLSEYQDAEAVSTYALAPFSWAVTNGVITGTDQTHLSPRAFANRAQCAAILSRFHRWITGI